jgi:uncharacterized protein
MQMDKLRQIMDMVTPKLYMMQTNGLLLDKLEPRYVNRFNTLLVSIDGEETLQTITEEKAHLAKLSIISNS